MRTEADVRDALRQWISGVSSKAPVTELSDDTPLFRSGILKSVQISDLILYIEELTERAVDVKQIKPGVFRDIDTIYRNFFVHNHA